MRALLGMLGGVVATSIALPALAATIVVTTTADPAPSGCGLRNAIVAANTDAPSGGCAAGSGADVIDLLGLSGTIHLGTGATPTALPLLTTGITFHGPGADRLSISGDGSVQIFVVFGFDPGVVIEDVTLVDGTSANSAADPGYGGCILSYGTLGLRDVRLTGCSGQGAIYVMSGVPHLDRVLIDANLGSGISVGGVTGAGGLVLENSTVSGNGSTGLELLNFDGPGPFAFVYGSTFVDNGDANLFVPIFAGDPTDFPLHLDHVLLAHEPPGMNCAGQPIFSDGFNIANDESCELDETSDLIDVDPEIGPLADNGGPTASHLPLPGSPAIDSGAVNCPGFNGIRPFDQRGEPRPADGDGNGDFDCDRGAVEVPESSGGNAVAWLVLSWLVRGRRRASC